MTTPPYDASASPPKLVRRPCCPGGSTSFIEPPDIETSMAYRYRSTPAPVLEELDEPPPDERTAWHEAGHAVLGHAFGITIEIVTVTAPARVVFASTEGLSAAQEVAKSFAGYVGEMAHTQFWRSPYPEDGDEYLHRVETFQFGGCDGCQMAMVAWREVGLSAGIAAAREVFRAGQRLALTIGQRREVQMAIRALAASLMETNTIAGPEAHAIIEPYVKNGDLANAKENQEAACG